MTALVARHLKKVYQGRDVVSELSLLVSPGRSLAYWVPTVQAKPRAFI